MRLLTSDVARAVSGRLEGPDVTCLGVSTDSRDLRSGALFVALIDQRDGHDFVADAISSGAAALVVSRPIPIEQLPTDRPLTVIHVGDTSAALRAIGALAHDRLPDRVVGITGSVGKTTTKDLLHAVLATSFRTVANVRSYNNEIGVPLTLANAPEDTEAIVVEMGARGTGHLDLLCSIARPTVAVVTRVGSAHTATFGDEDGVAAAKAELVRSLPSSGIAVLNVDDPRVAAMATETSARVIGFGEGSDAQVSARRVVMDRLACPTFILHATGVEEDVHLRLHGRHQVSNALAAAATGVAMGVGLSAIARALGEVNDPSGRMRVVRDDTRGIIIDDTYNANPTSLRAALDALASVDGIRRVAVLGAMAELGADSDDAHRQAAAYAEKLGIDVFAFRCAAYGIASFDDVDRLLGAIGPLASGLVILVKGSRSAQMEQVSNRLAASEDGS